MKQNVWIIGTLAAALAFFVFAVVRSGTAAGGAPAGTRGTAAAAATVENGVQVVNLVAKGGYSPATTDAKAGLPTVLRVATNGTYDCSSAIRIPSLSVSQNLPPNGTTDISLGTPAAGTLKGTCSMGMYRFAVNFK